jgi:rhodanese-related sulfurtransferase
MYSEFGMEHEITIHDFQALRSGQHAVSSESSHQFCLLDVREPWEAEMAAIAGSHRMPMQEIPSRAQQELHPDAHIVVYCHHGRRSLNVVMWLREQGFSKSQSLAGGIDAWSQTIDPSIPRY